MRGGIIRLMYSGLFKCTPTLSASVPSTQYIYMIDELRYHYPRSIPRHLPISQVPTYILAICLYPNNLPISKLPYLYPSYLPISQQPAYILATYLYPSNPPISKLPTYILATYLYPSYLHISKLSTYILATYIFSSYLPISKLPT